MKTLYLFPLLLLAGCQSAPRASTPPRPAEAPAHTSLVAVSPPPAAGPARGELERKLRLQAQHLEALMSQNDALRADLAAASAQRVSPAKPEATPQATVPPSRPAPATTPATPEEPALAPNADGIIDLSAPVSRSGEPANPFAVRTAPEGPARELLLHVSGLIAGPVACAVVNGRLVQAGDAVESLRVERVEAEAVVLRGGERRLRLPLADKPVRVRLPN
jgi:hypothetical protein